MLGDRSELLRGRIGDAKFLLKLKADHIGEQSDAVGLFALFGLFEAKKGEKIKANQKSANPFVRRVFFRRYSDCRKIAA
jgi:hypothetical protein